MPFQALASDVLSTSYCQHITSVTPMLAGHGA